MENAQQIMAAFSKLSGEISDVRGDVSNLHTEVGHLRDGQQRAESGIRHETAALKQYIQSEVHDLKQEQISDLRDSDKRQWDAIDELRKKEDQRVGGLGLLHWIFLASGALVGALGMLFGFKPRG